MCTGCTKADVRRPRSVMRARFHSFQSNVWGKIGPLMRINVGAPDALEAIPAAPLLLTTDLFTMPPGVTVSVR